MNLSIIFGNTYCMKSASSMADEHCHLFNITKNYTAEDLAAFHGHLGPFIVLGYRIGNTPATISATIRSPSPLMCTVPENPGVLPR